MAITEAGRLPYYSGWHTVDLWGLNTPELAKKLVEPGFVERYRPDLIVLNAENKDYGFLQRPARVHDARRSWSNMVERVYAGIDRQDHDLFMVPHKRSHYDKGLSGLTDTITGILGYARKAPSQVQDARCPVAGGGRRPYPHRCLPARPRRIPAAAIGETE